jgi:hypothetical protein
VWKGRTGGFFCWVAYYLISRSGEDERKIKFGRYILMLAVIALEISPLPHPTHGPHFLLFFQAIFVMRE